MVHPSSGAGSKELRRHARQATLQTARIRFGEGVAIPCEIRDYCQTGLYVSFLGEGTPDTAIPALVGAPVQVEFAEGAVSIFRFDGHVARVEPSGVGIFVAAMPEGTLQSLRQESGRQVQSDFSRTGTLKPKQVQALQQACTSQFRGFLDAVLQDLFQWSVARLGKAGQDELIYLERTRYESGIRDLLQYRRRRLSCAAASPARAHAWPCC